MQWQLIMGGMLCIPTEIWQRWKRCDRQRDVSPSVSVGKRIDSIVPIPSKWERSPERVPDICGTLTPGGRATLESPTEVIESAIQPLSLLDGELRLLPKGKAQSKTKLNPISLWKLITKLPTLDKLPFLRMTASRPALRKFWSVEKPWLEFRRTRSDIPT